MSRVYIFIDNRSGQEIGRNKFSDPELTEEIIDRFNRRKCELISADKNIPADEIRYELLTEEPQTI